MGMPLGDALIGRLDKDAEVVTPGPHAWDGSYTRADYEWKGHKWRVESAHDGEDLVLLVTPLKSTSVLPPTVVFSVGTLWNSAWRPVGYGGYGIIATTGIDASREVNCTCELKSPVIDAPVSSPYFAVELTGPVGA